MAGGADSPMPLAWRKAIGGLAFLVFRRKGLRHTKIKQNKPRRLTSIVDIITVDTPTIILSFGIVRSLGENPLKQAGRHNNKSPISHYRDGATFVTAGRYWEACSPKRS